MEIFKKLCSGHSLVLAAVVVTSTTLVSTAQATTFDTTLADPPGVYFGSGNVNANFVTNDVSSIELGLGTVRRYIGPVAPDPSTSDYHVLTGFTGVAGKTGTDWGFVFSINTDYNASSSLTLADITASLCAQDVGLGTTNCFDPLAIPDNALSGATGAQNSEALQFLDVLLPDTRFIDPGFLINADDTYIFTLSVFNGDKTLLDSVQMTDIAGTGAPVPEPVTISLFGAGLFGAAAMRRRRKKAA